MPGIKSDHASCTSASGSLQYTAQMFTTCHSITQPGLQSGVFEGAVLAAWTAVLYAYYSKTNTGLLRILDPTSNPKEDPISAVGYYSIGIKPELLAGDSRSAMIQAKNNMVPVSCRDIRDEFIVLWVGSNTDNTIDGSKEAISCIGNMCKPRLMLVLRPNREDMRIDLYSHNSNPAGFRLCGIINSLDKAVGSVLHDHNQSISAMDIMSEYDANRIREWRVQPRYDQANCMHTLINRHYHENQTNIAISTTSGDVTYADLGKRSAVVAAQLRAHGAKEGSIVGFCLPKSATAVVILVGILRAGAGYVAIDTSCPDERMAVIIESAGIKHLVCEDNGAVYGDNVRLLDPQILQQGHVPIDWHTDRCFNPQGVAYIMFTSGSTGLPKGAVHTQQGLAGSILEAADAFSLGQKTRFLQYASFSFDASMCELFAPLAVGGVVCIPSARERVDDLQSVISRLGVTDASLTPIVAQQLNPNNVPSLKNLYIGGDAPTVEIRKTWSQRVRLSNIYGTTETGVWDTVKLGMSPSGDAKNIGRGIGATCWIVDPTDIERRLPIGAEGEIFIQSPYLAKGYLNDPKRTSEAFIEAPKWIKQLSGDKTSRVYRTGDLAKYNKDGDILFHGRQNGFVKIRGLRIDLGEIESCLDAIFPGKMTAVVVSNLGGQSNEGEIIAFVEKADPPGESLADYVKTELSRKLPSYMVPTVVIPTEEIPLTDSKKLDRPALRGRLARMNSFDLVKLRPGGLSVQEWDHIHPKNKSAIKLSHLIADILEESMGQSMSLLRGRDFPLSSVGLNSVQLMYLCGRIRRDWGCLVRLPDLQKSGVTPCEVADLISNGERNSQPARQKGSQTNVFKVLDSIKPSLQFAPFRRKQSVFCTSVTGFLGSHILRSLLECPDVDRIIGLVRADDETKGRERVKQQARLGKWWKEEFSSRIDIWTGDVDAVIHNGARVHWVETFEKLKPANVDGTIELLKAISPRPQSCRITYVSGGYLPSPDETREKIAEILSPACGYDQTKYLSQLLMEEYNSRLDDNGDSKGPRAQTVQPGYIVGTQSEGIAHTEDFLWRLAYTILKTGVITEDVRQSYIPVAGVDQVAALATESALGRRHTSSDVLHCRDGIYVFHFCDILSARTGKKIQSVSREDWFEVVRSDIDNGSVDHPFLPMVDWFEQNYSQFTSNADQPRELLFLPKDVYASIEKSVEYLVRIGYLPAADGYATSDLKGHDGANIFRRSRE